MKLKITILILWNFLITTFPKDISILANTSEWSTSLVKKSDLKYLLKYKGEYLHNTKLLGNNPLTKRLKTLIKNRYHYLIKTWAVETPIEINNNMFSAWGCQQHNCSNTNFIIVVDFKKNVLYVGIREEEKITIYSEDGSINTIVSNWAKRIS